MLIKYKERYSVLFRIITLSVIFLFLWNDLSFALAPKLGLTQEQFQNEYLLKSFLLSHQAVNKYISRQIDPSRLIKIDVTKLEGHRSDKVVVEIGSIMDKQEIGIVAIEGLLKNTGQLAHIGLGVRNDVPVIYIDKLYFHDETVIGHEKEKIAGWEKFRRLKGFDYRQMRSWIKEHINKPDRAEKKTSRQIAEEINAASRNRKSIESLYARIKQKYKNFIAGDRRSDARALLDMANMYELYREAGYLLDENSKDINIAAHEADGAAIEPRQKIADAMLNDKYVVLLDELNRLLINAEDSPGELIDFLKLCDGVALGRPRYPIEGRYPILRAVAVMKKSDQDKLVKILESDPDYRRTIIIDSILLMLTKKIPAGWARMHAPYLTGRTVYQAAAEIWNPAGGLGRVMQFNGLNMYRICSACGIDYAQIEPFYDSGRNREGVYVPLDYAAIMGVDAENLKHIDSYDITANRQVHEAFAFEIINKDGIRMNLIGGRRKIDHFGHNYFTGGLYRYRNPSEPNLVTLDEFSGWYAAALVELQRRLEQRKYDRDPQLWKPPVAHYNDGQLGMAPYLLKTYYGDTIMSRATVAFTSHTFGNRCSFPGLWVLNGMGVPFENRKYATSQDGNTADLTSMGARTADWYGGVAAEHVDRILQKKYDTGWGEWQDNDMIAVTNGDEREITAHFYREKMRNILDGEKYPDGVDLEHPTPELALKTKAQCKSDMGLDPDLWTLSYQGRCMTEKAGRNRALTNYNIRALVKYGVQVIIGANSSSDPYIIDGLQLLADQLAREKAADPAGYKGSLTLVKNIDIEMQRKILAASDAQAQDSDPHSEAAGAQELDLAACGGIVIAPPWTEGSLQSQGVKIDLDDENSLGNIVVPEMRLSEEEIDNVLCDDEMRRAVEQSYLTAYKKLFKLGEFESDQPNKKLFRLQALSVRLSRVCEAILTAAEYLRQFSAAVAKKEGAIAAEPSAAPAHVAALSGPTGSVENIPATPESPAHTGFGIWMKQNSNSYTDEGYFSMSALGLRQDIDNGNIPGNFSKIPVDIAIADRTFHIDLAVHKSVLERLPEGMTIQQFIENCIKIRAPTQYGQILMLERLIKNLERKPFIIDAVSKSPSLYGDCIQNRYCYINLNAPSKLDITGISHEIMHESGRADEWELLKEDIIIAARSGVTFLDISKQIGNLLDMDSPLISLLRQLAPALPDDTPRPSTQAGEGVVKKIPKDKAKYLIEKLNQGTAAIHKIIDSEISAFPPKVNRANSVHYLSAKVKDAYKDLFAQIAGQIGKDIPAFGRLATEIERGNFSQQVVMEVLEETFMKSGLFILFDMGQFFIKEIDDFVEIPILNVYPVLQSEDLDTDMISRSIKMKAVAIEASRVPSYVKYRFGHDEIIAAAISKIKVDGSLPIIYIPKNLENQLRVFHAEFLNIADPARGGYLSGDVATRIPIINETFKRLITKQWAGVTITTSGDQFVRKYYNSFRDYVLRREAIRCVMQTSGELAPFLMDMAEGDNHWLRLFDFIRYLFKLPKGTSASNLAAASFILRHLVPHVSGVRIPEPELRKHLYMNTLFEAIPNMDEKALKGCARDLLQCLIQAKEAQDAARRPFEEVAKEPPANSMTRRQFIKLAAGGLLAAGAIGGGLTAITIRSKREIEKQMALERELERQEDAKIPSYPPEQKKKPLEERINALNADELAKKGIFFFGKDNYYRDLITGKQKRGSEKYGLFGFISWYTRFELTDLIEEALGEEISDEASENKAVAAALDKKAGEIRDSASAVSIEDRIRRLETKEEKLALLLSAIPNINRAHKHAGLIQGDFERLMKAHGLEWMLEEFPQLKSLFDLLLSINSVFYYSEKNFVEVRKILNEFNQKLFMPHGFYAPEDLIDNFIEGKIDDWLFKVRFRSTFQGKDICVVQRIRDNGARLNAFGIADRFKKTSRVAVVFYDETLDRAREHFQATYGQKRFIAGGFEDKELQKDFERDMTLLFIKAEEEDPRLKDFDFLLSFYIRDTIWHEIAHIIWGGEGEIVPYLSSICYSQPHLAGIVPISWMYNDDRRGVYSGIMAPITGMERESAPGIRGWRILQYRSVEKFRRMGAEEIRAKAKELLRNQAPALYKTLESEEGKRLRDDILKSTSSQGFSSPAATQQAGSRGIDSAFAAALAIFADNGGDSPIESKAQPSEKTANPAPAGDRQGLPREPSQNIIEDAFKAAMVIDSASEIAGVSLNAEGLAIVNEIHDELKGEIEKYGNRHIITSLRNTRDRVKDPAKKAIDELMDELNKPDGEFRYENPAYQAIVKLVRGWPKRHYHAHVGDSVHAKFKKAYLKSGRYDLNSWEKMITHVALQNFADGVRDLHLSIRVDREGVGTPEEVIAASIRGCKEAQAIAGSYLKGKFSAKLLIAFGRERKENSPDDIKPILEAVMKLKTGDIENIAGFDITGGEFIIGDEAVNPVYRKTSDYLRVIQDTVPAGILSTMRVTSHLGDWGHTYKSTKKLGRNGTELSDIPDVNERIGHHLAFIEDALNSGVLTDIQHGTVLAPADSLITKDPRKSNGGKYAGTRMGDIKGIDDNLIRIGRLLGDLKTRGLEINTCPTINCMSQKISLYKGHPLHQWIVKGNKVSINADDLYTSIPTTLSDDIVKMMLTAPERSDGRFLSPAMAREISAPRGAGSLAEVAKALPAAAAANPAPAGNMQALPREPIRSPYIISSGTDWTTIFDDNTKPIVVEVGFGGGRELLEMAKKNPQINYIGIDANIRMVNVLSFLLEDEADEGRPISNLKVVCTSDYEEFAVQTKNDIVSEMYYIYKDPRSPTALTYSDGFRDMARILKPGGKVFMSAADDVLSTVKDETPVLGSGYLAETMLLLFKEHGFEDVTKDSKFPHPSDSYPEKESVKAVFRKPPAAQLANGIEGASKTSRNTLYIDFSDIDADKFKAIVLKTKGAELSAAAQLSMNAFCEIIPKLYKVKSKWQKDPFYPQVCFFTGYSHDIEKILYANKVPFKSVSRRDFMWPQSSLFPEDRGIYELWADDREADHFHKYFIITVAGIDFVLDLTADQFVMEKGEYPDLGVFMIPVSMLTKCAWPYAGGQEFVESGNSSPADVAKAPPAAARRAQAGLVDSSQLTVDSKGEQGNAPGTRLTFLDILRTTKERLVSCVKSASYSPDDIPPAPGYDLPHDTFKPLVDAYGFLVTEIELDVEHEPDVVLLLAGKRDEYLNRINEHIKAINALRKSIIANRTLKQEYRLRLIGDDGFVSKAIEILNELKDFLDQYYNNEPPAAESLRGAGSPAELLKTPPAAVAADPTDLVAGLTKAQRQELKAKFKSVPGYDRIPRKSKGEAVAFYYVLKAAKALAERGAKIEEFEKRFRAGDYNMAGLSENDRKLVSERTALDADIVASFPDGGGATQRYLVEVKGRIDMFGADYFLNPHPKVSRSQKARYLVFAALTGRKVILVTEAPMRGYPIQEIVPVGQEGSLYLLSISKKPFESQLKIIKNNRILMRSALNKRVGIQLSENGRVLINAGIFVPVKHKPGYYRFADMMMNKGSDAEYTATLINVLEDVDYSLPIADLREFVKMAIISEMEKEFAVPDKKVMWHIIERDVIPEGQRSTLIQAVNNKFDRDNNGFERIRILRENETIAGAIAEIRSKDQDAIIDAALSDVSHIDAVGDEEVKKMVFTLEQGTEFIQLEGVLKALRALHYDDSQEAWRVLARLYSAMSGTASQAHFYMNKDGVYVFNLPKINRENINDFSKLNERLLELLTAA